MRAYLAFSASLIAILPAAAHGACAPRLVGGSDTVTLQPSATMDDQQLTERFFVDVANDGDEPCSLRLAVGRDVVNSDPQFPNYTLAGPNGNLILVALPAAGSNPNVSVPITVPANGQVSIPYDVRLTVGWGSQAGTYVEELGFLLLSSDRRAEIASQRKRLSLVIPASIRLRFAGAGAEGGTARVEMGRLSPIAPTRSPPFAIRVLSTAPYRMELVSQNGGALMRDGGPERIPYRMSIGPRMLNLAGGGDTISVARHTSAAGDVHPVSIVIEPDPARHAGNYDDRVTVTVTTL
jgi:hypothetical protein